MKRLVEFLRFAVGSALGLGIDLLGFQLLTLAGLTPGVANALSSSLSITVVYLVVTRYAFTVRTSVSSYLLFFGWYAASIVTFSLLIEFVVSETGWLPLLAKVLSVPLSFGLNYLFSRFLFNRSPRRGDTGGPVAIDVPVDAT